MSAEHIPCYNRFENETPALTACSTDGSPAHCCYPDRTACTTNGLCVMLERPEGANPNYHYDIGGCSVSDWHSDTCTDFCRDFGAVGVRACGTGAFCCLGTNDSCSCTPDSPAYFTLDAVKILQTLQTSSTSGTSSTTSTLATVAVTPIPSETSTVTSSLPETSRDAAAASNSELDDTSSTSMAAGLGAGLGIGIPLTILVLAGLWFWRRKRGIKQPSYDPNHYQTPHTPGTGMASAPYTEIPKQNWTKQDVAMERQDLPRYELPVQTGPNAIELGSGREAAELPSTRH